MTDTQKRDSLREEIINQLGKDYQCSHNSWIGGSHGAHAKFHADAILSLVRGRFEEIRDILSPHYQMLDQIPLGTLGMIIPTKNIRRLWELCAIDEPKPESEPTVDEYHDALLTLLRHTTTDIIDLAKKMDKERKP